MPTSCNDATNGDSPMHRSANGIGISLEAQQHVVEQEIPPDVASLGFRMTPGDDLSPCGS